MKDVTREAAEGVRDRLLLLFVWTTVTGKHPKALPSLINSTANSFSSVIRAAMNDTPIPKPTQEDRVARIVAAYVAGDITITSLDIELSHLPGGMPE